jgi:DNA repair exonuclease SbcCD ATPase subunit
MEAVVEETFKVRAKTYKELEMEQHPRPADAIHKKIKESRVKSPKIVTNRRVLRIDHTNIEPNITIKLGIQDSTLKDYDIAQDCGIVLEELIRAAERGEESYILLDKYDANKLDNSIVREREINQKITIETEQERIKRLENRNAKLKKEIIDKRGDLDSHGRHKEKLEKIEKDIREKRIVKVMTGKWGKKDLEELEQYKTDQKEKLEENRQKIKDLKEKVKEAEEAKRKEEIRMKDEEFRKFNLKRVRGYQQDYREKEVEFKNRSASMERARDHKAIHAELRLASAKKVEKFKERKQKTRQKKEAISKRIDALTKSPLYPAFLQRHLLQLRTIFDTYIQMELNSLNSTATADTLSHSSIQQFLRDFEIVPVVLKPNEEDKMTKEMISEKIGSTNMEFDFNFFKDFLHRLVVERPVLFEKAFDQRVATLKQFDDAAQQQAQYQEKIKAIKARAKEIELKKQKKKETLQVKDNPKSVDLRKKEEEAKQAILRIEKLKAKRAQEEEYIAKVSSNPVRLLEGLIAYLNVPSVKSQIQETINVNQSAKTLPTREVIKRKLRTLLDKLDDVEKLDKDEKGGNKGQENNKSRSMKDVEEEDNQKDDLEND